MSAADLLRKTAERLDEVPLPDPHEAIVAMLAQAINDVAASSPIEQADRVEQLGRVMKGLA